MYVLINIPGDVKGICNDYRMGSINQANIIAIEQAIRGGIEIPESARLLDAEVFKQYYRDKFIENSIGNNAPPDTTACIDRFCERFFRFVDEAPTVLEAYQDRED